MSDDTEKTGRTPLWQAIATALRADISEGRYAPGDKLPTEAELSERFGVNRHTVRHGIRALAKQGLLRSRRGSGVFVADRPTDYPLGRRVRFHENLLAAGRQPGKRILQISEGIATPAEAAPLWIPTGAKVVRAFGLSLADGQPVAVFESTFPAERLPGIAEALPISAGITEALRRVGISDYRRASTRLTAVRAEATQALHLHLSEGDPLLRSSSVDVDMEGTPLEFGRTWFAGDRITLMLEH